MAPQPVCLGVKKKKVNIWMTHLSRVASEKSKALIYFLASNGRVFFVVFVDGDVTDRLTSRV